jgi:hypothetical protein
LIFDPSFTRPYVIHATAPVAAVSVLGAASRVIAGRCPVLAVIATDVHRPRGTPAGAFAHVPLRDCRQGIKIHNLVGAATRDGSGPCLAIALLKLGDMPFGPDILAYSKALWPVAADLIPGKSALTGPGTRSMMLLKKGE